MGFSSLYGNRRHPASLLSPPAVASPATGWQVAACPLVGWNCIALQGSEG
jgi:hypothetical protein